MEIQLMWSKRLTKAVANKLCTYRGRKFAEGFEKGINAFHRKLDNENFNMAENVELRVLRIFSEFDPRCIFDVGANIGQWTQIASQLCPLSTIHAFEIVQSTFEHLIQNTNKLHNVIANNFGLSNEEGFISISMGRDFAPAATGCGVEAMGFDDEKYARKIQCNTRKAYDYICENDLKSIDFVKVDVEGMDLKVVKGFRDKINNVRTVQFEYGIFNISSRDLLYDFCMYFREHGFVVGKIFPKCVNFFEYHFRMENLHGSNYVAVRNEESELIEKLSRYSA
jgi:FkbM family methyltransferase